MEKKNFLLSKEKKHVIIFLENPEDPDPNKLTIGTLEQAIEREALEEEIKEIELEEDLDDKKVVGVISEQEFTELKQRIDILVDKIENTEEFILPIFRIEEKDEKEIKDNEKDEKEKETDINKNSKFSTKQKEKLVKASEIDEKKLLLEAEEKEEIIDKYIDRIKKMVSTDLELTKKLEKDLRKLIRNFDDVLTIKDLEKQRAKYEELDFEIKKIAKCYQAILDLRQIYQTNIYDFELDKIKEAYFNLTNRIFKADDVFIESKKESKKIIYWIQEVEGLRKQHKELDLEKEDELKIKESNFNKIVTDKDLIERIAKEAKEMASWQQHILKSLDKLGEVTSKIEKNQELVFHFDRLFNRVLSVVNIATIANSISNNPAVLGAGVNATANLIDTATKPMLESMLVTETIHSAVDYHDTIKKGLDEMDTMTDKLIESKKKIIYIKEFLAKPEYKKQVEEVKEYKELLYKIDEVEKKLDEGYAMVKVVNINFKSAKIIDDGAQKQAEKLNMQRERKIEPNK